MRLTDALERALRDYGLDFEPVETDIEVMNGLISFGYGHPITGLEKFLGYWDSSLNIANFPSVSLTADYSVCKVACAVSGREQIYVRGLNPETVRARVEKAMRALRSLSGRDIKVSFYIEMERKYPAGKGLGESAAVSAAAARAVAGVLGISDPASVSRLARLASGSGTRSVAGPLSLWLSYAYMDERRCYALPVPGEEVHLAFIPQEMGLRTEGAHSAALRSPYYSRWKLLKMRRLIRALRRGLETDDLLRISMEDMWQMHGLLLSSGLSVQDDRFQEAVRAAEAARSRTEGLYFTADTGPSLVFMSTDSGVIRELEEEHGLGLVHARQSWLPGRDSGFEARAREWFGFIGLP